MRKFLMTAAIGVAVAGPVAAQSLNDVRRLLLQQVAPGQQQPSQQDHDRAIYEQGRQRTEQDRRYDDDRRTQSQPSRY